MAMTRKEEARALDAEERELVARTRHPAVQALDDDALARLKTLIRARRGRAKALARRKRRRAGPSRRGPTQARAARPRRWRRRCVG